MLKLTSIDEMPCFTYTSITVDHEIPIIINIAINNTTVLAQHTTRYYFQ